MRRKPKSGKIYVTSNHCVNTGTTYFYEIRDGEIVAEWKEKGKPFTP